MQETPHKQTDRRQFIKSAGAATALSAVAIPHVFAQGEDTDTLQLALIGCGGRVSRSELDSVAAAAARATATRIMTSESRPRWMAVSPGPCPSP